MAGALTISTLNDSSGVLATQNGMTGIAKAWLNYNAVTQSVRNSFNVSSVTYVSTGRYTVNFTTAMPNANYVVDCGNIGYVGVRSVNIYSLNGTYTTTSVGVAGVLNTDASTYDADYVNIAVFSS
jgi:hypothetical protein